jgi:hypothetical protein
VDWPSWCGGYDDDDFDSMSMCCACGGGNDVVTSDGTEELPWCSWSSSCDWDSDMEDECADALCTAAGYESGTFISSDVDPCTTSTSDELGWMYSVDRDEYILETGTGSAWRESAVTAECSGSGGSTTDSDGDGWDDSEDCAPTDPSIHPGAEEVCDGVDNNCSDSVDDGLTAPTAYLTDGVCDGAVQVCDGSDGWTEPDYGAIVGFETVELSCDDLDNDCNGETDEGDVCGSAAPECVDTDDGAADSYGDTCAEYVDWPSWCGGYDDDDFDSMSMCCACGGGNDVITSDGTEELPYCTWSTGGCTWDESVQEECAVALCEAAGYASGSFISADHSMCDASATDDAAYYWMSTADEYVYGTYYKESTITAECSDEDPYIPGETSFTYSGSVESWTVPAGVTSMDIEVLGSVGGDGGGTGGGSGVGGKGARMSGTFAVTAGTVLSIYAGGNDGTRAGGDCSYVSEGTTPLVVAGGGGGGAYTRTGSDAPVTEDGTEPIPGSYTHGVAGTGGNGGGAGSGEWGTGGGGGWWSAGTSASGTAGGAIRCMGSAGSEYAGGAGGGYSGGGGTAMASGWGTIAGGSGGSYNIGTDQDNAPGVSADSGTITIVW